MSSETASLRRRDLLSRAQRILEEEGKAVLAKATQLDDAFCVLVDRILRLEGHVVLTGVGKSGTIGEKISSTLASMGTPSFYLRPVEALHGDLGMLGPRDLLVALSNSGETTEVLAVASASKALGIDIVAFTGNSESSLAKEASLVINTGVEREACPLGLAPTSSTTVTLAVGDALAMVLAEERQFTRDHYARFHPGGSLGQRLRFCVRDIMRTGALLPLVEQAETLERAMSEMTRRDNVGVVLIVSTGGTLTGILTDGDLRRILLKEPSLDTRTATVERFMTPSPKTIEASASAADALQTMEVSGITSLAVVNHSGIPEGLIHLHDILGRGKIVLE